jgi:hypothetical protein
LSRILAAGVLAAAATFGVWALLLLGAFAIAGQAGSPSPITELVGMGFPVAAILLAPVIAGVAGGLVAPRLSGLVASMVGYLVMATALSYLMSRSQFIPIGAILGVPLMVIGHWAGAAARPNQVRRA